MHPFSIPASVAARVAGRCGTPHPFARLDARRTALVVIDMQNGFMRADLAHALCPMAEHVVPAINRLAGALRQAGGAVYWIQNTFDARCETEWSIMQEMATPEARARRAASMSEGMPGHALWPALDVQSRTRWCGSTATAPSSRAAPTCRSGCARAASTPC